MTRECPYAGIQYKVVSISKPHAPDDDDDEQAAYALKRPIYEAAAEANRSITAARRGPKCSPRRAPRWRLSGRCPGQGDGVGCQRRPPSR